MPEYFDTDKRTDSLTKRKIVDELLEGIKTKTLTIDQILYNDLILEITLKRGTLKIKFLDGSEETHKV